MADKTDNQRLFDAFPPISNEEWRAKIENDLKGADFDKKLVWRSKEGFKVQPYYRADDLEKLEHLDVLPGEFPYTRSKKVEDNSWFVRQDIPVSDMEEANKKALDVLMKGVDALGFVMDEKHEYTGEDIASLLRDIVAESIELNFTAGHAAHSILEHLMGWLDKTNQDPAKVTGSFDFDPLGHLVTAGNFCKSETYSIERIKELIENASKLSQFRVLTVHGVKFNNAGATAVEELAFTLAQGNEYLAKLTDAGLPVDTVAKRMKFKFGVGSSYFMEIAKFRAARMLWAKMVNQYEPKDEESCKMQIHAETSAWNKTLYDPYVNMLRTTTEGMSAALAGVDSMTIRPFNDIYEDPSVISERIARNQQIILKEESYFDKVIDPSAGSYYIEELTDALAEEAWKLFVTIEEKGGFIEAFKQGFLQNMLKETTQKRDMAIATRRENLLGTNQFPNFDEKADKFVTPERIQTKQEIAEETIGEPIRLYRGSEAFELMRLKTDRAAKRPKAFMLTFGNLNMRKARAQFSCNFFACAGFEVMDNNGFDSAEEGVKAARQAQADIVVLCSSDEEYAELAPQVKELLKGDAIVVVAGYPKAIMDDLKAKGIEHFIHVKSNLLEELKGFQQLLGIQ
ncbi:MAG: methylmalonyl-CoA mutase family protein [Bacteroidota bacterium]